MSISRRSLIVGSAATATTAALAVGAQPAAAAPPAGPAPLKPIPDVPDKSSALMVLKYKAMVPEIFKPRPSAPAHSDVLVIGSGFGASVAALRLAQAGQKVTVLERGSRWPRDPKRAIFATDALPDGRGFWFRKKFTGITGIQQSFDSFGGVLDVTEYANIHVWRGAAVGGGSHVFTGVLIQPERRYFEGLFGSTVNYDEMDRTYYPRAMAMLKGDPMPADIYASAPFGHSRRWDNNVRKAGYEPQPLNSIFNWDVIRKELNGTSRKSATVGETNLGNANGAKYDLTQNYLLQAEATNNVTIHPGHVVQDIGQNSNGTYWATIQEIEPTGKVTATRTITCNKLFLGAGSIGTSELLVKAKAKGSLPRLNNEVGQGWGTNGDAALVQSFSLSRGLSQGSPSPSRISDSSGTMPVTLENWGIPGVPLNVGLIGSLGMTLDPQRASFRYDSATNDVVLDWPRGGNDQTVAALRVVHNKIAKAAGTVAGLPLLAKDVNAAFTAHPLGGAVVGKATDAYGRVLGYSNLYVMDAAIIPGNTGAVNPVLTITALAERNIEEIIRSGR
ncbi:GMC oxidoreductase [Klugiella xanthotipulae]|uniref:Cholesterol oxidase n=1 Tax=Klugiella xanthotipulae TaxID=244735 RepID=A0A543HH43_9MICO|nr:GMC oxidoreductase [Klugiella xanthotipulae]TQM57609.1 cholesterol oxidase [Klugiella xanthotipulae]